MPETFAELIAIFDRLEKHYRDMQDLEFTIQDGKLWMLQTRSGKRTAQGRPQDCRGHGRRRADHES
jgi:pyruvate,orthophosphate dikinase